MHIPFKNGGIARCYLAWVQGVRALETHPPTLDLPFLTTNPGCLSYADHQAINWSNFERNHVKPVACSLVRNRWPRLPWSCDAGLAYSCCYETVHIESSTIRIFLSGLLQQFCKQKSS
jgi:hypothetical protein